MKWKFLKNRFTLLGLLFFFSFNILLGRLMILQIAQGADHKLVSERVATRVIPLKAPRGTIYDRNGKVLAWNKTSFNVDVFYYELLKEDPNSSILKAVQIIQSKGDSVIDNFPIKLKIDSNRKEKLYFQWISDDSASEDKQKKEQRKWTKMYGFDENISPKDAFDELVKLYRVDNKYSTEQILKILNVRNEIKAQGFKAYYPVTIAKNIKMETMATLEELNSEMTGVVVTPTFIREYPNKSIGCHILGYIGKITGEDWEANKKYYKENGYDPSTDLIGRSELEKVLEPYLHGKDGGQRIEVDVFGKTIRVLQKKDSIPGNDVYLTIDYKLQEAAQNSLKETMDKIRKGEYGETFPRAFVGSAVVMDIKTGDVLALASVPDFDPNFSVTGQIDPKVWKEYNPIYKDPKNPERQNLDPTLPRPMTNSAVRGAYPPGSTFKMLVAAAGLQEGVINPDSIIVDKGRYTKISQTNAPACWIWNDKRGMHGPENVISALRDSCNYYFYEVGNRLGIDNIEKYAKKFGLGQPTQIELPAEVNGIVAGKTGTNIYLTQVVKKRLCALSGKQWDKISNKQKEEYEKSAKLMVEKKNLKLIQKELDRLGLKSDAGTAYEFYRYIVDYGWSDGKTLSAAIGQAENTFTPLQMANYVATLVNGGTRYKANLIDRIVSSNGNSLYKNKPEILDKLDIDPKNHQAILLGMRAVTSNVYGGKNGTAARYFQGFPIEVGGKTGTAQFNGHDPYAWFVSFAPYDDPQIAVAVVIGQGGHGGYATDVAKDIYRAYFNLDQNKETDKLGAGSANYQTEE